MTEGLLWSPVMLEPHSLVGSVFFVRPMQEHVIVIYSHINIKLFYLFYLLFGLAGRSWSLYGKVRQGRGGDLYFPWLPHFLYEQC